MNTTAAIFHQYFLILLLHCKGSFFENMALVTEVAKCILNWVMQCTDAARALPRPKQKHLRWNTRYSLDKGKVFGCTKSNYINPHCKCVKSLIPRPSPAEKEA